MADELDPTAGDDELDETVDTADETGPAPGADVEGDDETGDEDDDGADANDTGDDDGADAAPAQPVRRRANETIRELRARARRAEEERDEHVRRLSGVGADPGKAARDYEAEQTRLLGAAREREALGETGAVAQYFYERSQRESNFRLQSQANTSFERDDSREFRALMREIPAYGKVKEFVEDYVAKQRAMGNYAITREAVAKYRLGELAVERAAGGGGQRQRDRGERRIVRQTVRSPSNRSDQSRPSRRKPESEWSAEDYERNLGNTPLTR